MSLHVDDLTVYYQSLRGDVKAVDGATFEIADGEIMGLAGESGCGKSTLGKSLIRLDARMRYVDGQRRARRRGAADLGRRGDERVPVQGGLDHPAVRAERAQPDAPDRDDGDGAARARGTSHLDAVLPELKRRLELVGLPEDVLDRFPIELSGGMKQRVVMVLSSLLDPSLLIADEVTSALDVSTQRAVAELLVEFRDRGFVKSMIVITHDLSVLYQIADTILVMYAGKLAEKAPAATIVDAAAAPVHAAAALVAARGRRALRREAARRASRAGRRRCSIRRPAAASGPAARSRSTQCAEEPPFVPIAPGHAGRLLEGRPPDARGSTPAARPTGSARSAAGAAGRPRRHASTCEPGEVVSLIGESGSGKSTIGKMILRLLRTTRGHDHLRRRRHLDARGRRPEGATTPTSRASSRTRSARTTRSSRPTASSR